MAQESANEVFHPPSGIELRSPGYRSVTHSTETTFFIVQPGTADIRWLIEEATRRYSEMNSDLPVVVDYSRVELRKTGSGTCSGPVFHHQDLIKDVLDDNEEVAIGNYDSAPEKSRLTRFSF